MKRTPLARKTPLARTAMKRSKPKASKGLRLDAKGRPCLIRVSPDCDGGGETTVLCHYALAGVSGMGLKSPDELAAWGCHACHAVVDGRAPAPYGYSKIEVRLALAEAVLRTIHARLNLMA